MTTTTQSKNRKPQHGPAPKMRVSQIHIGPELIFVGFLVTQEINGVELLVCEVQAIGHAGYYDDAAHEERDRLEMLDIARKIAADPSTMKRFKRYLVDYRDVGRRDSTKPVPAEVYDWYLYEPGKRPAMEGQSRQLFPYCPVRMAQMEYQRRKLDGANWGAASGG